MKMYLPHLTIPLNFQVFLLLWWWCLIIAFIGFLRLVWRAAQCRQDGVFMQMMELI